MTAALIITLRETLEAALVVGVILAYLDKSGNNNYKKNVWYAVLAGIGVSIFCAYLFQILAGGFEGTAEQLYEGATMWLAAGLLTWMILWMLKQRKNLKAKIENAVQTHIEGEHSWGLFLLTFVSIVREGIETVIFLQAASLQSQEGNMLTGGITGILIAITVAYVLFKGFMKISLRKFFTVTSALLILFAAGLFAHGLHELEEAQLVPIVIEHVWDINPTLTEEGVYPALHEKGSVGSILVGLFGYNGNPSLLEVISYFTYLTTMGFIWRKMEKANQ